MELLASGPRVVVSLNFLVIAPVATADQGVYTCTANNRAGMDEASATLTIFGRTNLIVMSIQVFSNPSQDGSCNQFNTQSFEVQSSITVVYMYVWLCVYSEFLSS